jgi:hypothetical protein
MGYPPLSENMGQCLVGMGMDEGPWLNGVADNLLGEMAAAAQDARNAGVPATFSIPRTNSQVPLCAATPKPFTVS